MKLARLLNPAKPDRLYGGVMKPAGFLESAMLKLIARSVEVQAVETIGSYCRVTFAGADLVGRAWTPGDMIQISFGGWASRSYTPFAFDAHRGTTELLAYVHGHSDGIGSAWMSTLALGERCSFVGPRGAVNLPALRRPAIMFGDETSISTAAALRATAPGSSDVMLFLEVTSLDAARAALDRLGLRERVLVVRRADEDLHLDQLEREMLAAFHAAPTSHVLLTGKAASIQRLYKALRRAGMGSRQAKTIAYWAPGRKGFSGVQR